MERKFRPGQAAALSRSLEERMEAHQEAGSAASVKDTLDLAVDLFYRRVMADPELEPYFRTIDMNKQRHKLSTFMLYILGGSEAYTGRDIWQVHRRMVEQQGLRRRHFDAVLQHMQGVLQDLRAPPDVASQALDVIRATLPQFRFPPEEEDEEEGSPKAAAAAADGTGKAKERGKEAAADGPATVSGRPQPALPCASSAAAAEPERLRVRLEAVPGLGKEGVTLELLPQAPPPAAPQGPEVVAPPAAAPAGHAPAAAAVRASPAELAVPAQHVDAGVTPAQHVPAQQEAGQVAGSGCLAASAGPRLVAPDVTWAASASSAGGASSAEFALPPPLPGPAVAPQCPSTDPQQQIECLTREGWALFMAGLLAGPRLGAGAAVWAAAAALVAAHLAAALAPLSG